MEVTRMLKRLFSIGILAIMVFSCLGNVSAQREVGLWFSKTNSIGVHGSENQIYIESVTGISIGGNQIGMYNPFKLAGGDLYDLGHACRGFYMKYNEDKIDLRQVRFEFLVHRHTNTLGGNYKRDLRFNITLPVAKNNWIFGVSNTEGGIGMRFSADDHYPGIKEAIMDTIHCYIDNYEIFNCPGGKYHEGQTWTVNFPNGQIIK
jgi:hypothetical protein